jgi:hypothetical protein
MSNFGIRMHISPRQARRELRNSQFDAERRLIAEKAQCDSFLSYFAIGCTGIQQNYWGLLERVWQIVSHVWLPKTFY